MDDLIEPRSEQILFFGRIVPSDAAGGSLFVLKGNPKMKLQASELSGPNLVRRAYHSLRKIRRTRPSRLGASARCHVKT
jgi:hypothetical protein